MTSFTYLSRPVRLLSGLAAMLSLTACPDEGIVDPFASGGTDGSSSGEAGDDGGPSPMTTAPADSTSADGTDTLGPADSTGGEDTSTGAGEDSTTSMVSGGSSSTGDSMGESSSEGSSGGVGSSSGDDGIMATLCPVDTIDTLPFTYNDSISGEADEFGGPCGGGGAPDHAYTLVAPEDGYYVFDTFGSSFDTVLYVLDGDCGGSSLACNDDTTGTQSEVSVQLTAGETITIVVDSFGLAGGNYVLNGTFFGGSCPDGDIGNTVPQTVTGDTSDDGDNTTEGACGGGIGFDDSYTFTAPAAGVYVFDTEGSAFNTVLYAFDGDCNGAQLGCNDDIGGGNVQSRVYATMAAGQQIVLVVDGAGAASGAWQLNVGQHECPAEDLGNTAPQTSGGTTTGLPNVYDSTCAGGGGPEIGLSFTAPVDGTYVIDTNGSGFDTVLSVLDGATCAGAQLACDDDGGNGTQSQIVIDLAAGQEVVLMVDGYGATSAGNYTVNIGVIAGTCPDLDLGSTVPQTVNGDTSTGDNSGGATCGGLAGNDEAWTFTAPNDGVFVFDTIGSVTDTILYVLDGDCNGASLGCNDDATGTASAVTVPLTAGQEVVVVVDGDAVGGAYTLNVGEDVCPDQDIGNMVPFTTMGSTAGASNTTSGTCGGGSAPDHAFLWTAPAAGAYTINTDGSGYDTVLYVLDGATCGGASLACDDDGGAGLQSQVVVNLAADQQVVIVVDGFSSNSGAYVLNIN